MRFTLAALAAGFAGVAIAQNATASDVYVTEVVTAFTTYCPEATQLTHGGQTYTVSEATTLTVTNCPGGCTIVKPASSTPVAPTAPAVYTSASSASPVVPAPYSSSAVASGSAPVAPVSAPSGAPYPSVNGTTPVSAPSASGTGASSTSSVVPFDNAANGLSASFGGIVAAAAVAAIFL